MSLPVSPVARPWGLHLIVDLYGCDMARIRDADVVRQWLADLVKFAVDNPDAAGYSAVQLITTSSITGHFAEGDNTAYLDLFSCKRFDAPAAARFIADYFGAIGFDWDVLHRGRRRR